MEEEVNKTMESNTRTEVVTDVDYKDKYIRALADYDNAVKNTYKRINTEVSNARKKMLKSFIELVDDFERAQGHEILSDGVKQIYDKMVNVLRSEYNCVPYGFEGDEFNADIHSAISSMKCDGAAGKIVLVMKRGYKTDEDIIRYAEVIVGL